MIDLSAMSNTYRIRRLCERDAESILRLCEENTQYYEYCGAKPTMEEVLNDLRITPPGIGPENKYYVGFYLGEELCAVMDLIDGYPAPDIAFIGFFMMKKERQGRNEGSAIIRETAEYLRSSGKTAIRLGIDKGNPQSTHFWKKNGFVVTEEIDRGDWIILAAEKML
ncbi:MAG: GNAT family N-acetyltransferase [Clostridia bacterium]|nr:GNAT family N-acetyltransferase [Clostridia bacterium]